MEKHILKFNSMNEAFLFAKNNCDRDRGSSCQDKTDGFEIDFMEMMMRRSFARFGDSPPGMPMPRQHPGETLNKWTDGYSFDEYIDHFHTLNNKNQNTKRLAKIKGILQKYIEQYNSHFIPQNIFQEHHDVSGSIVDVGKFLENDPYCMINFGDQSQKKSTSIVFQAGAHAGSGDRMSITGEIVYCLNQLLKNRTINLHAHVNISEKLHIFTTLINNSCCVLAPQLELILLNLKAFFRRVIFACMEGSPKNIRDEIGIYKDGNYGCEGQTTKKDIIQYFDVTPDIVINRDFFENIEGGKDEIEALCENLIKQIVCV